MDKQLIRKTIEIENLIYVRHLRIPIFFEVSQLVFSEPCLTDFSMHEEELRNIYIIESFAREIGVGD